MDENRQIQLNHDDERIPALLDQLRTESLDLSQFTKDSIHIMILYLTDHHEYQQEGSPDPQLLRLLMRENTERSADEIADFRRHELSGLSPHQ